MPKQKLRKLLAQNEVRLVTEELMSLAEKAGDQQTLEALILQSARFDKLEKAQRAGTMSFDEINISSARINQSLLELIDKIPFQPSARQNDSGDLTTTGLRRNWWKYLAGAVVVIGILTMALNLPDILATSGTDSGQLTIYVHGPKGQQDYLLENEGELLVDLDGDRRWAKIGEKGRTVFNEIPAKFKGELLPIAVKAEGYKAAAPVLNFKWEDKPIYFEIMPDDEKRQIKGIVKRMDGSIGIANVTVLIQNEFSVSTDSLGRFSFTMEADQVQEKYDLSFQKEGFETKREFYYPGTSAEFRLKQK